eukprot:6194955-Pleurochrysis_carterae.AAC.2
MDAQRDRPYLPKQRDASKSSMLHGDAPGTCARRTGPASGKSSNERQHGCNRSNRARPTVAALEATVTLERHDEVPERMARLRQRNHARTATRGFDMIALARDACVLACQLQVPTALRIVSSGAIS